MRGRGRCVSYIAALSPVIMLMLLCVTGSPGDVLQSTEEQSVGGGGGCIIQDYIQETPPIPPKKKKKDK